MDIPTWSMQWPTRQMAPRVVSGSHDRSVRIWDLSMGEEAMILKGHSDSVTAVAYSPDGTRVVSGSRDKSVRVWTCLQERFWSSRDIPAGFRRPGVAPFTGGVVKVFMGHIGRVNSVGYSFDGAHVVSGSDDRSIRVWDALPAHTPRYVRQQGPRGGIHWLAVVPSDPSAYLCLFTPKPFLPDDANVLTFPASAVPQLDFSNAKLKEPMNTPLQLSQKPNTSTVFPLPIPTHRPYRISPTSYLSRAYQSPGAPLTPTWKNTAKLVARGATPLMISAYSLRFSLQNGIVAHADDALFENFQAQL
ncbi:WD40-repeat-containing domain protein [Coprinopsis sp. MPI-PUGE-AT-0042]|nr:WD40-repeat-containing domain protein [Coprinopsis sp. MPI-PUGE-AT-0042]